VILDGEAVPIDIATDREKMTLFLAEKTQTGGKI
jgi:hypothetical protein